MSPRAWRERIRDILDAVAEITAFTQGIAFDVFRYDVKTMRAVELNFIIIGEAASHIPEDVQREQHLDNLRRKDSLRGAETTELSVRLGNSSASHVEGSA